MMNWNQRALALAVISAIFGAGTAVGMVVQHRWLSATDPPHHRGGPMPTDLMLRRMSHELELDPSQTDSIRQILDDTGVQAHEIWQRCEPDMRALRDSTRARITPILSAEQAATYDRIGREFERKHHKRFGGKRGPPRSPRHLFNRVDRDDDQRITRDELQMRSRSPRQRMLQDFEHIDTDSDGGLTLREVEAWFER